MGQKMLVTPGHTLSADDTVAYHTQLLKQFEENPEVLQPTSPDNDKLIPFNGYYALSGTPGAFFAIDANLVVNTTLGKMIANVSLVISLDGITATRYPFTGSFDGTTLTQTWNTPSLSIELVFSRTGSSAGAVANFTGTISLANGQPKAVSGTTYNNPIPISLYQGDYYIKPSLTDSDASGTLTKAMSIGSGNQLSYDYGKADGELKQVPLYAYNMNMYYFSFMQGSETVSLIMGTAANKGFACNNMTTKGSEVITTRSLLTQPNAVSPPMEIYDLSDSQLTDFSGYYSIEKMPGSFISIQAQYGTLIPNKKYDLTFVMISISIQGVDTEAFYFDPFTMTFDGTVLSIPDKHMTLTLKRNYNPSHGSLTSLTAKIKNSEYQGVNLFNPVPLTVFGGKTMTNPDNGDSLTINNDNKVTYNGQDMDTIIYVPLMYILAFPAEKPTVVMSFGTNGVKGNCAIITTDASSPHPKTTTVSALQ